MRKFLLFLFFSMLTLGVAYSQVTTSSLTGVIKDAKGETLIGATVKATHQPSGTNYYTSTNADGRYTIPNMRVGGPYLIEASYIGYEKSVTDNINLRLGEQFVLNFTLSQNGVSLSEVQITGRKDAVMNSKRTGASTNISKAQLESLPTLSRSLQDFTRLTPQANGNSFGGVSNRFNNITIDGAVNNDVFGLSGSGTPGGQASTQPISLDAIQEIQVVLAPYDVSYGNFTGGGVNAVTRSGTNDVQGSAYFYGKSQGLVGKNPLTDAKYQSFTDNQYGFRVGGPILKNKLFFFVSGEMGRRSAPLANNAGETGAAISAATAKQIADYTLQTYGYDVGSYGPIDLKRENDKAFVRLDWNINDKHQLTLRHNYVSAFDDNLSRSGSSFSFGNNAYKFNNKQNITVAELRSNFSSRFSNNLILGYSAIRDNRDVAGSIFPQIQINNIDNISSNSAYLGSERSSVANKLNQDIFEVTDNFKYYAGKHTFTFGTHNEFFKFENLFINNLNGRWDFNSVADYLANNPFRARATYSLIPGNNTPAAKFNAAQLGFYVQDEFDAFEGFRLTLGLRADVPIIGDKPLFNEGVSNNFPGVRTDETPSGKFLWAPRVGFNYDVNGDRSLQIRGGAGIFTGRVPFVWLSNQFVNSGLLLGTVDITDATATPGNEVNGGNGFQPDINQQKNVGGAATTTEINAVSKDFKIPQLARFNLAADVKLPYGIIGTIEGIYSKTMNNINYQDINLKPSTATINAAYSNGADTRPLYSTSATGKVSTAYTNVILLDNTNRGYNYSVTGQLQKNFDFGFGAMFAYTYGRATDVNSGTSSTALSNWEFVQNVNGPNNVPLATSYYETRHRLVGSATYSISYGKNKNYSTGISLFYSGFSGTPYTYLYNGDLNGDGRTGNDLLFVPKDRSQINLQDIKNSAGAVTLSADAQWANLDKFINEDPYLSKKRGQYTERNGARTPWEHHFDVRITQDIGAIIGGKKNRLQLTFDVFNVGNLLNKDWGRSYFNSNQAVSLISTTRTNGFTFNRTNPLGYDTSDLASRWQGQFGIRYLFN
ncbi:carboxypeptidase regulatory-like domain-containing protein [Mucilaginibacter roseus]|uniref:Carboxypeptidase regulatory-like domain-containing protein n=1 Tax=Mucilaginibacter roseus TaxID=1528868 RepID=A0ABS8U7H4_9SPHI|nr:carboxypeptidase regulatory-like domain-containing protein [Mucilaginibacter roseus]MCD8742053.1 carboxypeptidase regulatory-like domain-containing protein [Mucilaginibacter roseus]